MSSEHALQRGIRMLGGGRPSKKDQPAVPHPATTPAAGGVPDRHASPKPKPVRSSTLDATLSKPTNQDGHAQAVPARASTPVTDPTTLVGPPPPLVPNSTTSAPTTASAPAPAPNSVSVQALAPTPAVVPAPTPAQVQAPAPAPAQVLPPVPAREKRIGTPKPVDPQAERIQQLEEACRYYESQAYHRELLSIRNHLQVNDLQEPWQISQKFQEINKKVENVSRNLSEYLADRFSTTVELRASNFVTSQNRLNKTERDPPIPAEDFVDFHCRSLINEELMRTLFDENLFHPVLESGSNKMLSAMYGNVRLQESQVIAGRWRVSSFNTLKDHTFPSHKVAFKLCRDVLLEFCRQIYGDKAAEEALNKFLPEITAVFEHAWLWYSSAKSSLVMLDFQPYSFATGTPFQPEYMNIEGRKLKAPSSGAILLTNRLGLISSEALGDGKPPQQAIQAKATVLTSEYFLNDH